MNAADAPLTDDELSDLDDFLLSEACDAEALTLDEAHGLLTAAVAGPVPIAQDECLELVWGAPRFEAPAEAARMSGLLLRLRQDIERTLEEGRTFEPLAVVEEEEDELFEGYEGWCFGFMLGVEQRQSDWESLPKDVQSLLAPMAQLALLASDEEPEMDEEEYAAWVELLPGAVTGLYRFWHG